LKAGPVVVVCNIDMQGCIGCSVCLLSRRCLAKLDLLVPNLYSRACSVAYVERSAGLANVLSITVRACEFVNATFVIYVFVCFGLAM
jgi:hypothetical protein